MARETQYSLYPDVALDSRVRHFDGQFLGSQDFVDEQRYHVDRLRRAVHHLRIAGITAGLTVAPDGPLRVTIAPGTAVDASGRQLVVVAARGFALPADLVRPGAYVLALRYAEVSERTLGGREGEPGTRGDTRFREEPAPVLHGEAAVLPAGDVALAHLAVAADGAVTVTTPPALRRYSGLRLPGPGDSGPQLTTGGDADPARLILAGALTVRRDLFVEGTIASFGVHVHVQSFKLGGATDRFYPVVFEDRGWNDGALTLEITRPNTHVDGDWSGSLMARFRVHPTAWGHGSHFDEVEIFQDRRRFIARYLVPFRGRDLIVWLRGGFTYFWRAGQAAALVHGEAAEVNRHAEVYPVLAAIEPQLDRDRLRIGPAHESTFVRSLLGIGAPPQDLLHLAAGGSLALRIQAGGPNDDGLIRFFHGDQDSQSIRARPDRLILSDVVHVQRGVGRVGLNTPAPIQTLDVRGGIHVEHGVIQRGGPTILGTMDLGLYSQVPNHWVRYVTTGSRHAFFNDGGVGTVADMTIAATGVTVRNRLDVTGDITYTGRLGQLDVAEQFTATIRAADLRFGHSTRSNRLGRALVDDTGALVVNCGGDWPTVQIHSTLSTTGLVRAPDIEWGNAHSRTQTRDNPGLRGDAGARSGFFETIAASPANNYPPGAQGHWHLLDVRHSNPGNNFALQLAGSFHDQRLWFRKTNDSPATPWRRVLTTDDLGVTLAGRVGLGAGLTGTSAAPRAALDVAQVPRTGTHPTDVKGLYVTGELAPASDGVEFRHTNGTQGVGIGHCGIYATGSNLNQPLLLVPRGTSGVGIGPGVFEPAGKLEVRVDNAAPGWDRLVVNTTTLWNGVHGMVTIGAGGAGGLVLFNPHVGWDPGEKRASIRYAHTDGDISKTWWDVGARSDGAFSFLPSGGAAALRIDPGGDATFTRRLTVLGEIEWGNNNQRTQSRDNPGLRGDAGARSGFFETIAASPANNYPPGAQGHWHLLDVRHSNPGNNFALQLAGSFYDQRLWFRKTNNDPAAAWRRVLTTDDIDVSPDPSPRSTAPLDRQLVYRHILDPSNLVPDHTFLDSNGANWHALAKASINPFRAEVGYPQSPPAPGYHRYFRLVGIVQDNWARPANTAEDDYCIEFGFIPHSVPNIPDTRHWSVPPTILFSLPGAPDWIGSGANGGARHVASRPQRDTGPLLKFAHPWGWWKGRVRWGRTEPFPDGRNTWLRWMEFQVWDVRTDTPDVMPALPLV